MKEEVYLYRSLMYIGETDYSGTGSPIVFRNLEDGIVYGDNEHNIRVRELTLLGTNFEENTYKNSIFEKVWEISVGNKTHFRILKKVEMR